MIWDKSLTYCRIAIKSRVTLQKKRAEYPQVIRSNIRETRDSQGQSLNGKPQVLPTATIPLQTITIPHSFVYCPGLPGRFLNAISCNPKLHPSLFVALLLASFSKAPWSHLLAAAVLTILAGASSSSNAVISYIFPKMASRAERYVPPLRPSLSVCPFCIRTPT